MTNDHSRDAMLCEQRFLRMVTLAHCMEGLVGVPAVRLRDVLALMAEQPGCAAALLLMPELKEWIRHLEQMVRTWAMFPSKVSALQAHLDLLGLLVLSTFSRATEVETEITLPGTARLDFPDRGLSVSMPLEAVGANTRLRADSQHLELPSGVRISWDGVGSPPSVMRHPRLPGGTFVRQRSNLDFTEEDRALIHRPRDRPFAIEVPPVLETVWLDFKRLVTQRGVDQRILRHGFRVVIVARDCLRPGAGLARMDARMTAQETLEELLRAFRLLEDELEQPASTIPVVRTVSTLESDCFEMLESASNLDRLVEEWRLEGDSFRLGCASLYLQRNNEAEALFNDAVRHGPEQQRAAELLAMSVRYQFRATEFEDLIFGGERIARFSND